MTAPQIILIITLIVQSLSTVYYIWLMVIGKVVAQRMGWFILTILGVMYLISGLQLSAGLAIYFLAQQFMAPLAVFLFSLKYGKGGVARLDILCLVIATIGIVLWKLTSQPLVGLFFACFSDSIGAFLVAKSAIAEPDEENPYPWMVTIVSVIITILVSGDSTLYGLISTIYIGIVNLIVILSIFIGYYLLRKRLTNQTL
jgi:hypothetical protein